MKVLHIIQSVNPETGGPIEALVRSEAAWRRDGHHREIVSLDLHDDPWTQACPITTHALGSPLVRRWTPHVPFLRYGFAPRLVPWLRRHASDYDAIVVNGLWNYTALAARLVLPFQPKPYFVFTHGMLDPWFRKAYPAKHFAKQMVWLTCEGPLLQGAKAVLFTCEGERKSAEGSFRPYRLTEHVAGYGTADPPVPTAEQDAAFRQTVPALPARYLLFLGRLHEKKGCDLLVEAFAAIADRQPDLDLAVAGPDSAGWQPKLEALATAAGVAHRLHWCGMLHGEAKWGALHGCEAFVLPSHGENFGVAVAEALACGKPVLLSDKVNIATDIEAQGGGLVAPDTLGGTIDLLQRFVDLSPARRVEMGRRARSCFETFFDIETVALDTLALFSEAVAA